jgi:hypothetical protein
MQKKGPKDTPATLSCKPVAAGFHADSAKGMDTKATETVERKVTCLSRLPINQHKFIPAYRRAAQTPKGQLDSIDMSSIAPTGLTLILSSTLRMKHMAIRETNPGKLDCLSEWSFSR